jgi:hypothetical protein
MSLCWAASRQRRRESCSSVAAKADRPDLPIWRCSLRRLGFVNYKAASAPGDVVQVECAYPDSTGSDLIDTFSEALEPRRQIAQVLFDRGLNRPLVASRERATYLNRSIPTCLRCR